MWVSYVSVDDTDAALDRATANGGKVLKDAVTMDGIGRFGIFADDQGAVIGVIKPAAAS